MNRLIAAFALAFSALSLSACNGVLLDPNSAPAPLEQTAIDERGLVLALTTFDTVLDSVDILIDNEVIVPGTPRALQIADAIDTAKAALSAASAAQRAGSTRSYGEAISEARAAIETIRALINPG